MIISLLTFFLFISPTLSFASEQPAMFSAARVYGAKNRFYEVSVVSERGTQVLKFNGTLELSPGILTDFLEAVSVLNSKADVIVEINSIGGTPYLFKMATDALRKKIDGRLVIAVVPPKAECSSACIEFFLRADVRVAASDADFGFHAAANILDGSIIRGLAETILIEAGLSAGALEALRTKKIFETLSVTYLSGTELNKLGALDRLYSLTGNYTGLIELLDLSNTPRRNQSCERLFFPVPR